MDDLNDLVNGPPSDDALGIQIDYTDAWDGYINDLEAVIFAVSKWATEGRVSAQGTMGRLMQDILLLTDSLVTEIISDTVDQTAVSLGGEIDEFGVIHGSWLCECHAEPQ